MSENKIVFPRNIWADPEHPPAICGKDIFTKLIPGASRSVTMISLSYLSVFTDFEACAEFLFSMHTLEQWLKLQDAKEEESPIKDIDCSALKVEGKTCCLFDRPYLRTQFNEGAPIHEHASWTFQGLPFRLFDRPTKEWVFFYANREVVMARAWDSIRRLQHRDGDKPARITATIKPARVELQAEWYIDGLPKRSGNRSPWLSYGRDVVLGFNSHKIIRSLLDLLGKWNTQEGVDDVEYVRNAFESVLLSLLLHEI